MNSMIQLTKRNLWIFFRDRASVFFSLLALIIIIGLYVLFLGDMMQQGMSDMLGEDTRFVMDSWIMAGIIGVASLTTTMGAYGVMVDDRKGSIAKDFRSAPVRRGALSSGYMLSAFFIGVIMCLINLVIAEIYIVLSGGRLLSIAQFLQMIPAILLSVLCNSAIVLFMTSFFKSASAFGAASTVVGTLSGFLTGIYIPIGNLPEAVQWVIRCFPPSHAAAWMRQIMVEPAMRDAMAGAPEAVVDQVLAMFGVRFQYGDHMAGTLVSMLVLACTAAVFYALSAMNLSRKRT